ncbi:MAG TPA: phosphoribosylformylglycinamidine synthase subunit PurL [Candidatus Aerophobetes bacterium]|uniref:Phosphoribosylformylglycinamidine synthase subunit PurL n=1 Tax=Aerophobetes bacterium TaxID=2030807 RepID=A0A7V0QQ50_UNCAE|nr:phosphoribosylformylglycinamidine synthase subunit PurL [Candidatus Aerophobetes bacterium]
MVKKEVYRSLGLTDEQYKRIVELLGREPSLTEVAMFSGEWSEHCGYLSSRRWLKLLPKEGKSSVFIGEDCGGIIVDNLAIVFKVESHNHPSQVEPKQGAATGVGGIIRDIFTTGARPIACLNSLRFGPLEHPYNKYLLWGVVDGIQSYGNSIGVPTVGGEIYFEECYTGNCLVNVMSIGVGEKDRLVRASAGGVGNSIMYVGARTGRDGIGGCSILASQEFREKEEKKPSVQIGDLFTEKCLIEATLEAIATGYIIGIKDMGAAGLTCCVSEMSFCGNCGVEIELELVPKREEGMLPWEIMLSESQERLLVCVKQGKEKEVAEIFSRWGVEAEVIGKVIKEKVIRVKNKGEVVAEMNPDFLVNPPLYEMSYKKPEYWEELNKLNIEEIPPPQDYNEILVKLLSSPSICSKAWVYEQYDYMVQTNTIFPPGREASVLRLKGKDRKAIAVTMDGNSRYCYLSPYRGAQIAVAEAARNLACCGAEAVAITDCLNFGNPQKPDRFWQFKSCVEGIAEVCKFFNLAVVSGNVSFYNENPRGAIYPTPIIGMVGIIDDVYLVCSPDFKNEGDVVILLGVCREELGGSEYLKQVYGKVKGEAPFLDLSLEKKVQETVLELIRKKLINSAHDCSEGGLAVALAECCISGRERKIGVVIDRLPFSVREDIVLFGESQSRVILTCQEKFVDEVREVINKNNVPWCIIGRTGGESLRILKGRRELVNLSLEELSNQWEGTLPKMLS